jgi:hypothetical protein
MGAPRGASVRFAMLPRHQLSQPKQQKHYFHFLTRLNPDQ